MATYVVISFSIWPFLAAYGYTGGRSLNFVDPSGLQPVNIGPPQFPWDVPNFQPPTGGPPPLPVPGITRKPMPPFIGPRQVQYPTDCKACFDFIDTLVYEYLKYQEKFGYENAMRHFVRACESTKHCGLECTWCTLEWREILKQFITPIDTASDRVNNAIGMYFGIYPDGSCVNECDNAFRQGVLVNTDPPKPGIFYLAPRQTNPKLGR